MSVRSTLRNPPNLLINGGFDFFQRSFAGVGAGTAPGYHTADRWMFEQSGSGSFVSSANSVSLNNMFRYSCHLAHGPLTNGGRIWQRVESTLIAPYIGKTMTFSIWVQWIGGTYSSTTMNIYTPTTSRDTWLSENTSETNIATATMPALILNSWVRLSITFVVPASANNGLVVGFQSNNTADMAYRIDGGMLTEGSVPPDMFYRHGSSMAEELAACQRFYEKSFDLETAPTNNANEANVCVAIGNATNEVRGNLVYFKVSKRVTPSVQAWAGRSGEGIQRWSAYDPIAAAYIITMASSIPTYVNRNTFTPISSKSGAFTLGRGYIMVGDWVAEAEL